MAEKVVLTKEQAVTLERFAHKKGADQMIQAHVNQDKWFHYYLGPLQELSTAQLARALLLGYEVESKE